MESNFAQKIIAVRTTISQDCTNGLSSNEEANLPSLFPNSTPFPLKTESVYVPQVSGGGGNHALQDYQMQLMLLEQQNKKRLVMARQEQDQFSMASSSSGFRQGQTPPRISSGGNHALQGYQMQMTPFEQQNKKRVMTTQPEQDKISMESSSSGFNQGQTPPQVAGEKEGGGGNGENYACQDYQLQLMLLEQQNKKKLMMDRLKQEKISVASSSSERVHDTQDSKAIAIKSEHPTRSNKRRKINVASNTFTPSRSKETDQTVDGYGFVTVSPKLAASGIVPKAFILHRIVCSGHKNHPATLFEDEPQRTLNAKDNQGHFSGSAPVYDVEEFSSRYGLEFLVFKDHFCQNKYQIHSHGLQKISEESISVVSSRMQEKIAKIAKCSPIRINPKSPNTYYDEDQTVKNEFEVASPYNFFFHHRKHLMREVYSQNGETDLSILSLLKYLEEVEGETWKEADELFSRGQTTLQHLQRLFKPNEIVIARSNDIYSAYMLRDWPHISPDSTWGFICWSWGFDGSWFQRKDMNLTLAYPFGEVADIKNLGVFPLRFAPKSVTDDLAKRGKRVWELRYKHYVSYTGWDFQGEEYHSSNRCMIDYQTYKKMHEHASAFTFSTIIKHPFDQYRNKFSITDNIQTEDFLLMPAYIHGFFLKEKKWISLYVDKVQPISWNKEAFQRLVLPSRTKNLVKALVSVRKTVQGTRQGMSLADTRDDLIAGKGNGLIMLLHGGPGTGKTLTAESVAEIAEMPLYSVTCGDIGTTAEGVEKYLKTILYLGKTWNCVLLLDEADVFLEERTLQDLERNSLVSVFLRVLEYYEGILILTSNRVGIFDEAFKSRIQVALHYETLNSTSRKKIWQNFFNMLQNDEEKVDFQDLSQHLDELADREMNGREIRNALTTARQIAMYQNETLCWEHLETTINTARDFTRYLGRLHGHTDEQWAREKKER